MRLLSAALVLMLAACAEPPREDPPPVVPTAPESATAEVAAKPAPPASIGANATTNAEGRMSVIDLTTCFELQQTGRLLLYDVRPTFVRAFGAIPGSVSWPKDRFEAGLPQHEPEVRAAVAAGKAVVLYCTDADCPDSHTVATRLAARGHDVAILEGGFADWKTAGLPVD